jgi:hypothetical protein
MDQKTKIKVGVGGIITALVVASGGAILTVNDQIPEEVVELMQELQECEPAEITLDLRKGVERVCLSNASYLNAKQFLLDEYNGTQTAYDFELDNRDLLYAVLDREKKVQGFSISGKVTKEKLREAAINLLK